jgi:hypothetical protein
MQDQPALVLLASSGSTGVWFSWHTSAQVRNKRLTRITHYDLVQMTRSLSAAAALGLCLKNRPVRRRKQHNASNQI